MVVKKYLPQNEIGICEVPKYGNELSQKAHWMKLNYEKKVNVVVWKKDKCHKHDEN